MSSFVYAFSKQALMCTCLQCNAFENTVGKGEIARNDQFLLFPQYFLPVWSTFCHFHQIRNCRLQTLSIWKSLKLVIWERYNVLWRYSNLPFARAWLVFIKFYFIYLFVSGGLCCYGFNFSCNIL